MDLNEVVHLADAIPGWMSMKELTWLATKARELGNNARWAELGCHCGRSLMAVGLALPTGATLVSVDVDWGQVQNKGINSHGVFRKIKEYRKDEIQIHVLKATTNQASEVYPDSFFDVVFIDADHSYQACSWDIKYWSPLVKPGGLICGHDYAHDYPEVKKSVDEAFPLRTIMHRIWLHQLGPKVTA